MIPADVQAVNLILMPETLQVTSLSAEAPEELYTCELAQHRDIRKAASQFTLAVADHLRAATDHVCSRCGVCCKRPVIAVTAQDIFRMARRLDFADDGEFRRQHVEPQPNSWNPEHGMLRHQKDGSCVFLETEAGGHTTRCRIYDDRPQSCIEFRPDHPACVKLPAKLVQHVKRIDVKHDRIVVLNDQDRSTELVKGDGWPEPVRAGLRALEKALQSHDFEVRKQYVTLFETASNRMDEVESGMARLSPAELQQALVRLREDIVSLENLSDEMGSEESPLDDLARRLGQVEKCTSHQPRPPGPALLPADVLGLVVSATGVVVSRRDGAERFPWDQHPKWLPVGRHLLQTLVTWDRPDVQSALKEDDPPCFRCGECCRHYSVEIHPYDIERLAANLGVTEETVVRKYTDKPLFSWNPSSRVLKKKKQPDGKPGCVFLERRDDGFWYCGVHAFKPDVCRNYAPTNPLCHKMNQIKYWPRMIDNLSWVLIAPRSVMVATRKSVAEGRPPLELTIDDHADLLRSVKGLVGQVIPQ